MEKLFQYFREGIISRSGESIGMEIETSFLSGGSPITIEQSQFIFRQLAEEDWKIISIKNNLITSIVDKVGNNILYELGRQNIEVATTPSKINNVIHNAQRILDQIYEAAGKFGIVPYFSPILDSEEDLLIIPDERDATWLDLDGRDALKFLAKISAVQFTIEVNANQAVDCLNRLGNSVNTFLLDYPQDEIWKNYIKDSKAGYLTSRYGGPLQFFDLENYCFELSRHGVVMNKKLVPYLSVSNPDIGLFIRSVWWYFRLKRYGNRLCIEIRPLSRRKDEYFASQLSQVLNIVNI
jgi:hypothetical protein